MRVCSYIYKCLSRITKVVTIIENTTFSKLSTTLGFRRVFTPSLTMVIGASESHMCTSVIRRMKETNIQSGEIKAMQPKPCPQSTLGTQRFQIAIRIHCSK